MAERWQYLGAGFDSNGDIVASTRFTVYYAPPYVPTALTTLAEVYSQATGAASPGNPYVPGTGMGELWLPPGFSYDVVIDDAVGGTKFNTRTERVDALGVDIGFQRQALDNGIVTAAELADGAIQTRNVPAGIITAAKMLDGGFDVIGVNPLVNTVLTAGVACAAGAMTTVLTASISGFNSSRPSRTLVIVDWQNVTAWTIAAGTITTQVDSAANSKVHKLQNAGGSISGRHIVLKDLASGLPSTIFQVQPSSAPAMGTITIKARMTLFSFGN